MGEPAGRLAGLVEDPDPWGLTPEVPAPPVAKKTAKPKAPPAPPDPGHQRCIDAYHDAFLARVGQRPIVGGREAGAIKRLRAAWHALKRTDDELIAWLRAFFRDDFRAESTSIAVIAADPSRFLKIRPSFTSRPAPTHMQAPAKNPDGSVKKPKLVNLDD